MKENNIDYLLLSACNMLRYPYSYDEISMDVMAKSLEILYQRIVKADCLFVFDQEISKEEYEEHFEELFTELNVVNMIAAIKRDYENIEGDTQDDN